MSAFSLTPQNVTVGEKAQLVFRFASPAEMNNFICDFSESDEAVKNLNNSPFFTIKQMHFENANGNAAISIDFIPWKAGELDFGTIAFGENTQNSDSSSFMVTVSPVFIRSVAQETNASQLAPPAPPRLIPGTSYLIYAGVASVMAAFTVFTVLLLRFKKIRTFFDNLTVNLRRSRNYRRMVKQIRIFTKGKYTNQAEAATRLVNAFRVYLQKRFGLPFCSAATFEIPRLLNQNFGDFYRQGIADFLPVLQRCDQLRFAQGQNACLKEGENKDLGLKLAAALNILENEAENVTI